MTLLLHLRIVGALLLALAGLNLLIPRHLGWDRDLEKVSLLNRQIYRVRPADNCHVRRAGTVFC